MRKPFLALALVLALRAPAQTTYQGPIYVTPSATDTTADIFSVWLPGATPSTQCLTATGCVFAVQANGSLWFLGNNATYGSPNQQTQSFLRFYGSTQSGTAPAAAPPYLQFFPADGSANTILTMSTTQPGKLCEGSSIPGGDCADGSQLATMADLSGGGGGGPASLIKPVPLTVPFVSGTYLGGTVGLNGANQQAVWGFILPPPERLYDRITIWQATPDPDGTNLYSVALYRDCAGRPLVTSQAQAFSAGGPLAVELPFTEGSRHFYPGRYCVSLTGTSKALKLAATATLLPFYAPDAGSTTGGVSLPSLPRQPEAWILHPSPLFALDLKREARRTEP